MLGLFFVNLFGSRVNDNLKVYFFFASGQLLLFLFSPRGLLKAFQKVHDYSHWLQQKAIKIFVKHEGEDRLEPQDAS